MLIYEQGHLPSQFLVSPWCYTGDHCVLPWCHKRLFCSTSTRNWQRWFVEVVLQSG
ncbi:unnamed protein product [Heligmosomoides polygyrus]|uniref:Uncharacterized protein n=1 Tax=Heligmosomoides polygyrus TaxID=6339 RepID=A0A3P7V3E7_HELPZ|nr:unnamed protein product [Heligmosomoides polygyrus]